MTHIIIHMFELSETFHSLLTFLLLTLQIISLYSARRSVKPKKNIGKTKLFLLQSFEIWCFERYSYLVEVILKFYRLYKLHQNLKLFLEFLFSFLAHRTTCRIGLNSRSTINIEEDEEDRKAKRKHELRVWLGIIVVSTAMVIFLTSFDRSYEHSHGKMNLTETNTTNSTEVNIHFH